MRRMNGAQKLLIWCAIVGIGFGLYSYKNERPGIKAEKSVPAIAAQPSSKQPAPAVKPLPSAALSANQAVIEPESAAAPSPSPVPSQTSAAVKAQFTAKPWLYVYSEPDTQSALLGMVPAGTPIDRIVEEKDGWVKVSINGGEGWLPANCIEKPYQ